MRITAKDLEAFARMKRMPRPEYVLIVPLWALSEYPELNDPEFREKNNIVLAPTPEEIRAYFEKEKP